MFSVQNESLHRPSERAERDFRRQKLFNNIILGLMIFMAIMGVWNVITIASIIRDGAVDLADTAAILSHISSRIIFAAGAVTLVLIIIKEWKWGDPGFATAFVLAPLLFLVLVPVMSAELQPNEESMHLEATFTQCEPGGIEALEAQDNSLCEIVGSDSGRIFMSGSNPADGSPELLEPDVMQPDRAGWDVEARGEFKVYFMLQQESMDACESSQFTTSASREATTNHNCVEIDGTAYSSHSFVTSNLAGKWFSVYQEAAP